MKNGNANIIMIKELSCPYVEVQLDGGVTYGGSQTFYEKDDKRYEKGCGMISMLDILSYLEGNTKVVSKKDYCEKFDEFASKLHWNPGKNGTNVFFLWKKLVKEIKKRGFSMKVRWGLSIRKIVPRVYEMLDRNIPVMLCVPHMIRKKERDHMLSFYKKKDMGMVEAARTNAHFVTITGVIEEQDAKYFRISSWGRCYYINIEEYLLFVRSHLFGFFLGNIMYIKPKIR